MSEKVGIEINLIGADAAKKTLEAIESTTRRLGAKKTMIKMENGDLISVEERIKQIQDRLAVLKSQQKLKLLDANQKREMERLNAELTILNRGLKTGTANARTFKQVFNSISSTVAHAGSAMQSMGNALTRLGSLVRPITTGLLMGAGYKALNLFTEGFSNAFERADIMKNYDRQLRALGLDVEQTFKVMGDSAMTAKVNLDAAVQGLPTSLDEIMAAQKVYAGATGEMVESTKTAIAANNAFLASGMGSREQRFMQKYLVALSSGAELTTTQWQSMARIAPLVMRAVSKELGYADDEYAQFTKDVQKGTIAGTEFLKAFQKVGVSGVVADAARAQTESWNGLFSNIRIAVTRMGANVLDTINQTFKDATGRTLLQQLLGWDANGKDLKDGVRSWINDISESVQNWIKSNPDRIIEFFENLKAIDFKGLLKGMAEGVGWIVQVIEGLAKIASNKDMSKVGRFLAKAGFIGRAMTIFGGLLKGMRFPIAGAGAGGSWLFGKMKNSGLFGRLASIFGSKKSIQTAGDTAKTIPTVADTFKGAFSALQGVMTAAGAVTLVAGAGFVAFKSVKSMIKDLKEIGEELKTFEAIDGYAAVGIITGIGVFTEIFNAIGTALGTQGLLAVAIASAASVFVTGAFAADMRLILDGVKSIRNTILEIDNVASAIENMKGIGSLSDATLNKFSTTIESINKIRELFIGKNGAPIYGGQVQAGIQQFGRGKVNALTNIAEAVEQMQQVVTQLNAIAAMSVSDPSKVIEDIKKACNLLQGVRAPNKIKAHTENAAEAFYQMRRMVYHINKLASMTVSADAFRDVVKQIKDALAELKTLDQTMTLDIKVVLGDGFRTSVNGVEKQIKDAKNTIQAAVNYVSRQTYKTTVTVTIGARVNTAGAVRSIINGANAVRSAVPMPKAMGGMVYRAKGGSIFKPRGTDTVPAMLTPGEFVHNRRAVNTFGIDFMRKVNNLDIRGAMGELMHRAGHMANVNRGTTITNNNYNNQRVTINNNGATGAGFTFKSASRFVGAF